jgi:cell division protein FtsI/penicillin-binding protein 2
MRLKFNKKKFKKDTKKVMNWFKTKYKQVTKKENIETIKRGMVAVDRFTKGTAEGIDRAIGAQPVEKKLQNIKLTKRYELPSLY